MTPTMIPTFHDLQRQQDEYDLLHVAQQQAKSALADNPEFASYMEYQFRIANNAVRVFGECASHSQRSWLVTIDIPSNQFTVRVYLDRGSGNWSAAPVRWETPLHGLYYTRFQTEKDYTPLQVWSNSHYYPGPHRDPIGEADLVGYTLGEPTPRAVYWLFDRCPPPPALRRQVSGNFVLSERRLEALPETTRIKWIGK